METFKLTTLTTSSSVSRCFTSTSTKGIFFFKMTIRWSWKNLSLEASSGTGSLSFRSDLNTNSKKYRCILKECVYDIKIWRFLFYRISSKVKSLYCILWQLDNKMFAKEIKYGQFTTNSLTYRPICRISNLKSWSSISMKSSIRFKLNH